MKLPKTLHQIAEKIDREGGRAILVGGAVRDYLFGIENKDLDVEVFGLHYNQLISILKKYGKVSAVGKAFGVLKLSIDGDHFDFSLPRNDVKTGSGHRGFHITTNPEMTFKEAASRRDFTLNAIGYDIMQGELLDEFNGRHDLNQRVLRVVDPETFAEDPLRVLRGIQFAARFRLSLLEETKTIFKELVDSLDELPRERIFKELKKLFLKSKHPSIGFSLADETGINKKLFPELNALHKITHNPHWYPPIDAWTHTLRTIDEASKQKYGDDFDDLSVMFASLCLEFAKLNRSEFVDEKKWVGLNLDKCPTITKCFMQRLTNEARLIETVDTLVQEYHSMDSLFKSSKVTNGDVRRLSLKVDIPLLVRVAQADFYARFNTKDRPHIFPAGEWLIKRYHGLKLFSKRNLQPILLGRHLIDLGLKPGPFFGKILNNAYQKQLDDEFITLEDALNWARHEIEMISN
ncbi:polynucleotide adenylyltransferase [bacterium]|nr:polynucleotide adenylyltransferase [bacterium]